MRRDIARQPADAIVRLPHDSTCPGKKEEEEKKNEWGGEGKGTQGPRLYF